MALGLARRRVADLARAKKLVNEAIAAYREAGAKGARGLAAAQAWIEARG